jgi:hypothetical protein
VIEPPPTLFELVPAVHRVRDAGQNRPLEMLLAVLQDEVDLLREDVEQLYDNWFIETCDDWVVPYIGDLLGVRRLLDVRGGGVSRRGLVANTIAYRRRKGTAAVIEQLAYDVTGWPAKAVEFFELLGWTQNVNHVRLGSGGTGDIRDGNTLELVDGPFDDKAHTADVRHIDLGRGRHNIPNLGVFLWRLGSYSVERSTARPDSANPRRYTFDPLGYDAPLFNQPRTELAIEHLAEEINVPGKLRRRALYAELKAGIPAEDDGVERFLSPTEPVFTVFRGASIVTPQDLAICDLSDPTRLAPDGKVAVDPELGRIALAKNATPPAEVRVSWSYGFAGDLGGGPYDRRESLAAVVPTPKSVGWQIGVVEKPNSPDLTDTFMDPNKGAIPAWAGLAQTPTLALIAVMDSRTYDENLAVSIPPGRTLVIAAARWDEEDDPLTGVKRRVVGHAVARDCGPHVKSITVVGQAPTATLSPGSLVLDGLLIGGDVTVSKGTLGHLRVAHSTIAAAPGAAKPATLRVEEGNVGLTVDVERSICGPIDVDGTAHLLSVRDSIIDSRGGPALRGPAVAIERSTLIGETDVRSLQSSDTIFDGDVAVERRQSGCVRYSYLPRTSRAPRRYRCHPDSDAEAVRVVPAFTSVTYGDPGYCQLAPDCPEEIARGADDEGEMGAFNFVQAAHRLTNLRAHLDEYLRFGLEAGTFFVT